MLNFNLGSNNKKFGKRVEDAKGGYQVENRMAMILFTGTDEGLIHLYGYDCSRFYGQQR